MSERDSQPIDAPRPHLSILFAAFTDSWSLFDRLGSRASSVLAAWLSELEQEAERQGGDVIKTVGNGLLVTFDRRSDAVRCAIRIMERVTDLHEEHTRSVGLDSTVENEAANFAADSTMDGTRAGARARIGLHYGPVVRDGGDIFGDAVNLAFRIQELAAVEQIIATRAAIEELPAELAANTRPLQSLRVKGREDAVEIVEIVWEQDGATPAVGRPPEQVRSDAAVSLGYRGVSVRVDGETRSCMLGRGDTANIVVVDSMASREHARVEYRGGQLLLTDFSTNGTYVEIDGEQAFVRRDSIVLRGSGRLSLGKAVNEPNDAVKFECVADSNRQPASDLGSAHEDEPTPPEGAA